jgi:prepilin-type N-terminal cleavage/methylation domain-containing protein
MKKKEGFTLIELLVVVLIIAILAAIALPQYYKAVRRSRSAEALTMLNAILKGQEEYYLIHDEYTNNIEDLSITIPQEKLKDNMSDEDKKSKYHYHCLANYTCFAGIDNADYPMYEFTGNASVYGGKKWCIALENNEKAREICEMIGNLDTSIVYGQHSYYLLK